MATGSIDDGRNHHDGIHSSTFGHHGIDFWSQKQLCMDEKVEC